MANKNKNYKRTKGNFGRLLKSDKSYLKDTDKYIEIYDKWNTRKHNKEIGLSSYTFDGKELKLPSTLMGNMESVSIEEFTSSNLFDLSKELLIKLGT